MTDSPSSTSRPTANCICDHGYASTCPLHGDPSAIKSFGGAYPIFGTKKVWVVEHKTSSSDWEPVGAVFANSSAAESDARRQLAYLNNRGHKEFGVRVSTYFRHEGL